MKKTTWRFLNVLLAVTVMALCLCDSTERVRAAKAGGIDNADIDEREDTTVDKAKSRGLPVNLQAGQNITVVAAIGETVLGKVDYSAIPADFAKNRSFTVSLINPNGKVFQTLTTSGNAVGFQVPAGENSGGAWRVKLDNATGYLDKQIFLTMTVKGLRNIGDGTPTKNIPK